MNEWMNEWMGIVLIYCISYECRYFLPYTYMLHVAYTTYYRNNFLHIHHDKSAILFFLFLARSLCFKIGWVSRDISLKSILKSTSLYFASFYLTKVPHSE